jgi:hypothetical protein
MIPETILDHELRPGSCVTSPNEQYTVVAVNEDWVHLLHKHGFIFNISRSGIESDLLAGYLRMPQATFCIWDTPTCTCGAAHTSYPNLHMRFCGEYKC